MKMYPVNPDTFVVEPVTDAQRFTLMILKRNHPEVDQIQNKAEATAFISRHIREYEEICYMLELESDLYFGLND